MSVSTRQPTARAWVDINLDNVVENARTVAEVAKGAALLPMVKADAYGLGAVRVSRALETLDPWGFGVASVEEGIELRREGIERPIVVFTPARLGEIDVYAENDLRAVVDDPGVAAEWHMPFHLEVDTGMGRCGVLWNDPDALAGCARPSLEGVFTHFYGADRGPDTVGLQWSRFQTALGALGERPALVHAANSAAAWRLDERLDLVRPGIFLYGGMHAPDLPAPLPAASLKARVVSLRRLGEGDTVSYGGEWRAPCPTTVATLGIGYADGIARAVQGKAEVLLGGKRRPLVGKVTMDFVMVALEDGDQVAVGDVATLIGSDGSGTIGIDEFARWSGTISYEVLARLGARLPRRYQKE